MKMLAFGQQTLAPDQKRANSSVGNEKKKGANQSPKRKTFTDRALRARNWRSVQATAGIKGILPALRTGPCHLFRCSLEPADRRVVAWSRRKL